MFLSWKVFRRCIGPAPHFLFFSAGRAFSMDFPGQKFALNGSPVNGFDLDPFGNEFASSSSTPFPAAATPDRNVPQMGNGMGNQMQMLRMQNMQGNMGLPNQQWGTGQPMLPPGNPMHPPFRPQQHSPQQPHMQGFGMQNQWNDMRARQQPPPTMPGMNNFGGMNGFGISQQILNNAYAMSTPIDRSEEGIIIDTLIHGIQAGVSHKEALNSLHGVRLQAFLHIHHIDSCRNATTRQACGRTTTWTTSNVSTEKYLPGSPHVHR